METALAYLNQARALALLILGSFSCDAITLEPANYNRPQQPVEEFILPPLDKPPENNAPLSQQQEVLVQRIRIRGNTVFTREELQVATSPYIGRTVTMDELQQLRLELTRMYIDKGYITSGVLIPDQKIQAREVTLLAVEGQLTDITVTGTNQLVPDYILRGFSVSEGKPVNLGEIQEQLLLLKQDPMITRLNANLAPGNKSGASTLALQVEENKPYNIQLAVNNARNPSIGAEQAEITASYHSFTGWGDTLTAKFHKTEGLNQGSLHFLFPLTKNIDLFTAYQKGDSDVVEQPFNEIDVESEYYDVLLGARYLPVKRLHRTVTLALLLQKRKSETFLFGQPFSFSPGVQDGVSAVSVLRLTANWLERWGNHVFSVGGTLSRGLDMMEATINNNAPDGRFTSFLGQLQYAYRFSSSLNEIIMRCDFNITDDALLPLEKFSVGGVETVRGYRENTLIVDQGIIASIEYRFGLIRNHPDWGNLQGATFFDYGITDNKNPPAPRPKHISSLGVGLNWQPTNKFNAQIYAAKALTSIDNEDYDWQDSGVHFNISYRFH